MLYASWTNITQKMAIKTICGIIGCHLKVAVPDWLVAVGEGGMGSVPITRTWPTWFSKAALVAIGQIVVP